MADDQMDRQLSAALRAQASGLGSGSPPAHWSGSPQPGPPPGHRAVQRRPPMSAWSILALALLLGAMAGGLAGVISAW
jgi:hypothetical protein